MCFSKAFCRVTLCVSSPPDGIQRISLRFAGVPSLKYCWVASVLLLTFFFFSAFVSATAVLLNHISKYWADATVVVIELCWTPRRFHISSTAALEIVPFFQWASQSGHCCLEECSQSSKISVLFKSAINSCDSLLNLLIFFRLAQILKIWFLMLWVLELLDQLLDFVLACCILLLDCRKRYSRYSVIHSFVTSFTVTFRIAWWFPRWHCVLAA